MIESEQLEQLEHIKQLKNDYLQLFQSEAGKRVLIDLEKKYHIHNTTYYDKALGMAFNEGQRSVVLYIQYMINLEIRKLEDKRENAGA